MIALSADNALCGRWSHPRLRQVDSSIGQCKVGSRLPVTNFARVARSPDQTNVRDASRRPFTHDGTVSARPHPFADEKGVLARLSSQPRKLRGNTSTTWRLCVGWDNFCVADPLGEYIR